jgi:hypothetical protein
LTRSDSVSNAHSLTKTSNSLNFSGSKLDDMKKPA